jgi:hypothetical protein
MYKKLVLLQDDEELEEDLDELEEDTEEWEEEEWEEWPEEGEETEEDFEEEEELEEGGEEIEIPRPFKWTRDLILLKIFLNDPKELKRYKKVCKKFNSTYKKSSQKKEKISYIISRSSRSWQNNYY